MSHTVYYPQEHKMVAFSRRASTFSEKSASATLTEKKRPSVADNQRKSSLSNLSLRLTRSKRSRSSSIEPPHESNNLGQLFFLLPPEIQSEVLSYLPLQTFFSLRLTSRSALQLLYNNASSVTTSILKSPDLSIPHSSVKYIQTLFPPPASQKTTNYLLQCLHRHHAIKNVTDIIINFIQMKIYMIRNTTHVQPFSAYRTNLPAKLYLSAWTTVHYLESYRKLVVYEHPKHTSADPRSNSAGNSTEASKFWSCWTCASLAAELTNTYPAEHIFPTYHFYSLLLAHLRASSRAPTYAGTIERKLRGWSRKPPCEEQLSIVVILGGMERMAGKNFSVMRGTYNQRLEVLGSYVDKVEGGATVSKIAGVPPTPQAPSIDEGSPLDTIGTPFHDITEQVLDSLPHLDDFLLSDFQRRILEEDLLKEVSLDVDESEVEMERQRELGSPFGWVRRLMGEIDEEGEERGSGNEDDE